MTRIQRLVGVPSPRAPRRGGWMAPVAMAAVIGTVSALALARTEPRSHHPERSAEALDRIDLVEVLARHEAREARLAGKLNHENIVRVYSTGVREGTPWYSMEYVEGIAML